MMEDKVYIVRCKDYDDVEDKLGVLLDMMGGMGRFARQDEKIVLKVNLLREARPEAAVSTHPSIVAAVGRLAGETGAVTVIADSPEGATAIPAKPWTRYILLTVCIKLRIKPGFRSIGIPLPGRYPIPMVFLPNILTLLRRFMKQMRCLTCAK
jgi:hypothetical protein